MHLQTWQHSLPDALTVASTHADEVETIDSFFEDPPEVPAVTVIH